MERLIKSERGVSIVIATILMVVVILAASIIVYVAMVGQIPAWQQAARPPSAASPILVDQVGWYDENLNKRLDGGDLLGLVVINNGASLATIDRAYVADTSASLIGAHPGECIYYVSSGGKETVWVSPSSSVSVNVGKMVKIAIATTRGDMGVTYFQVSIPTFLESALDHDYLYLHNIIVPGMSLNPAYFMDTIQPSAGNPPTTARVDSGGVYFYTNPLGPSFLSGSPHKFEIHLWLNGSGTVIVKILDCDPVGRVTTVTGEASQTFNTGKNFKEYTLSVTNPTYILRTGHRLVLWVRSSSSMFTLNFDGGNYKGRVLVSV